jgi:flagellar hook-associated protein 3 FlgL
VVTAGVVRDAAAWDSVGNPKNFEVRFAVDSTSVPPTTTYDIVDTVNNLSLTTGLAPAAGPYPRTYQSGAAIVVATQAPPDTNPVAFDYGIEFSVTGTPSDGDTFTVEPSTAKDIFSTLNDLITTLETAGPGATLNTRLTNSLNSVQNNLDNALDVNLTILAAVGAFAKEVETNRSAAEDLGQQFARELSGLRDLDYAKAITELTYQRVSLEAAQKSFMSVQELSLFALL